MREFRTLTEKPPSERIPDELGGQCRVLELMTRKTGGCGVVFSRYTYHLLNGLRPVSNTGAHLRGERQTSGTASRLPCGAFDSSSSCTKELES